MCCGDKQVWRKSINRGEKSDNTKAVLMSTPFLLLQNAVFPLVTTLNRVTDRFCYFCYNISHYYVTLVAEATVWLTHWPQATVFSWGNKLTQCPSTQWGRQILKCTRTSQDSSRWFGIIATAEIHYSKHFIWKEWPELCKQVHAWEIWMSLSSKVQQLRVYIPRPSPFNRKPKYEVREIMQHAGFFPLSASVSHPSWHFMILCLCFCWHFTLHPQTTPFQMKMSPTVCWSPEDVLPVPRPPWSHVCHPVYPSLHTAVSAAVPKARWCSPAPLRPPCLHCHVEVHPDGIPHRSTTQPFPKDPCACHTPTETVLPRSSPCQHAQTPATSSAGKTQN